MIIYEEKITDWPSSTKLCRDRTEPL